MAHRAGTDRDESEIDTLAGSLIAEAEVEDVVDDLASIDRLLAETDEGWDVEAQVLTLKQAAATKPFAEQAVTVTNEPRPSKRLSKRPPPLPRKAPPPLPAPSGRAAESWPERPSTDRAHPAALFDLLAARVAMLEKGATEKSTDSLMAGRDTVGLARAHMELAIASETILGDDGAAIQHAEAALQSDPNSVAAHALLRRKKHSPGALAAMLEHLEHELSAAATEAHKVELLAERGRLLEAIGDRGAEVRATWEQVLAHAPHHAAALKGLEAALVARALASRAHQDWEALAVHLGRMAEAYSTEKELSAWLQVERALILERNLERIDAARGALERALELDPKVGPVRDALVRHVARHADWGALARLLDEEACIESNSARAAWLELDAATMASSRLGDRARACSLLDRAAARAPTSPSVDRRVLDELVRLHELDGRWADAARARRARIQFVTDPAAIAYELRCLAAVAEKEGDVETAIADVQRALAVDATDPMLVETLDRLLSANQKHEQRIAAWLQEAARAEDVPRRTRALARAAKICEELDRPTDALRHLRSAWVTAPGDAEILDSLARLLSPAIPDVPDGGPRSLVELYAQAADQTHDVGRKVAYLERAALLWEELLGDPGRAARAYEQVLAIDSDRRSAIVGLERTAARAGDVRMLARALLAEARLAADSDSQLALRTRAASVLAKRDPTRAMQLVREVLQRNPANSAARALETRLDEEAGRWELAAKSLRVRIDLAQTAHEKVALWLALAQMHKAHLHGPAGALAALEEAHALDPSHPVPPEEIARLLEDWGDARTLRDAIERLASQARTPEERARHLARAAEIDELRLGDDASAVRTYRRALADVPDDGLVAERLARVVARRAQTRQGGGELAELATVLGNRIEHATSPAAVRALSFQLAALLVETGQEPARAASLLEANLLEQTDHVPALRSLESLRRRTGDAAPLARVLARQGEELKDMRARLGALWGLAALEEWRLPVGDSATTYRQILDLDPTDPAALEATVRRELPDARKGDPQARKSVIAALRALVPFGSDDDTRLALQLRLALLLEAEAVDALDTRGTEDLSREALGRYRDALRIDEVSVIASTGLGRLAERLGDAEATLAAARSSADLATDPRLRARYLVDAAELLTGPEDDDRLGSRPERRKQAAALLERALEADPDSIAAAGRLATVLLDERQGERVVSAFRAAINSAKSLDCIVLLGSEIARIARDELKDLTVAIDAMRRVRAAAPQHVPSLLTLAELCIEQRAWQEAVEALEAVASNGREPSHTLTALFALASIYEKVLARPQDVERVLRAALALEPRNARALKALLRRIAAEAPPDETSDGHRARRDEIADLLGRLAQVEQDPDQKTVILLELSEVNLRRGDAKEAERALVDAVATSPANARAFARLSGLFRRADGTEPVGYARALSAVIGLGQQRGRLDARWFAALGHLEIHSLSRTKDGIAHLQRAVALDPTLYETRFEIASAYASIKAHEDTARSLLGMIAPSARPLLSIADPPAGLALLEQALAAQRQPDEAGVVTELRALAGELDETRYRWLRSRRLPALGGRHGVLDRPTLVTHVLPIEGRHILLEVAAAIAGIESKILRSDLTELGIGSRDRMPSRGGHPTRLLLDRVARQLGVGEIELAVARKATRTRVLAHDVPWVIVPPSLIERNEQAQIANLARAVAHIAYGIPWLEELAPPNVEALLIGAARQVVPTYGDDTVDARVLKLVAQYESALARALSRRQRKLLEELSPHIASPQSRPPVAEDFVQALLRAGMRTAFLATGDLLTILDEMGRIDAGLSGVTESPGAHSLAVVLEHPIAGDVVRFALTAEATVLRQRIGSIWTL